MAAYTLTNEERETQLLTNAAADRFKISTADPVYIRKLEKLADEFPDVYIRGEVTAWGEHSYTMPKRLLRFGKPASEAKKEQARRMIEKLRTVTVYREQNNLQQLP